jgi:polysaccharide export outer membrane protein
MRHFASAASVAVFTAWAGLAGAQTVAPQPSQPAAAPVNVPAPSPSAVATAPASVVDSGIKPPADYVIGSDDVLNIVFWRDKDMSNEVQVRPDGKISLPLLNDVQAAGMTPEQLRVAIREKADKLLEDPEVSVVVKAINSRRAFITGQVAKPGIYPLLEKTTVLQLIAMAGGVSDFADSKKIQIVRAENGKTASHKFNYEDFIKGKNVSQNIELKPGDTIIVP